MQRVQWPNTLVGGAFLFVCVFCAQAAPLGKNSGASATKPHSNKTTPVITPQSQTKNAPTSPIPRAVPEEEAEIEPPPVQSQPIAEAEPLIGQTNPPKATAMVPMTVHKPIIITREDIEHHYGYDIAQILQTYLNLDVRRVGGPGAQSEVFFLGAEQRHIAIYVDDVRVTDRTLNNRLYSDHVQGGIPWHLLPLSQIGWIEIREGLEATRQGEGAIAASVHIFTRRPLRSGGSFGGVIANHGMQGIELGYNGTETNAFVDVGITRHEGISATNSRSTSFNGDLDGAFDLSARAGYQGKWSDSSIFDLMAIVANDHNKFDQGESVTNWQFAVAKITTLSEDAPWHQQLRAAAWHKLTTYSEISDHRLRTAHSEFVWENRIRFGSRFEWNIDTHFLADAARWTGTNDPRPKLDTKFTTNTGIGMTFDFPVARNEIGLSARFDHHVPFGGIPTYGIRWGKDIRPSILHASVAIHSGYAAPTLEDRYSMGDTGGINAGSPSASFEKSTRIDTTWRYQFDTDHDAELMLYGDRIDSVLFRTGTGQVLTNDERYDLSGARLSYRYRESDWQIRLIGDLQSANGRKGTLPYRPEQKLLIALAKRMGGGYALDGSARMINARKTPNGVLDPYAVFDLSVTKNYAREYDVSVVFSNLFDKVYETEYGFNMPGQTMLLHFRYTPRG